MVIIIINDLAVNFQTTNISTKEVEWKNRKFYPKRKNKNRTAKIEIPKIVNKGVHGFSHEHINCMLGGSFRASHAPLNDNIINGRIRGVAGGMRYTNPRVKQDWVHVEMVKEGSFSEPSFSSPVGHGFRMIT